MLEPGGGKDDLEDIVDLLNETEADYILLVRVPKETRACTFYFADYQDSPSWIQVFNSVLTELKKPYE